MKRVALAVLASCVTPSPSPPPQQQLANAVAAPRSSATALEGRVLDVTSAEPVQGIDVEAGALNGSEDAALSDEHGRYRVEVEADSVFVQLDFGPGKWIPLAEHRATQRDLYVDHDDSVGVRQYPAATCPSSPAGAKLRGHSTPQAELDAIAYRVLERYAADPSTLPDGQLVATVGLVNTALDRHRALTAAAMPPSFTATTRAALDREVKRAGVDIYYVNVEEIEADATCAAVRIEIDFAAAPRPGRIKMCRLQATQLYELRGGRWEFVRDIERVCT